MGARSPGYNGLKRKRPLDGSGLSLNFTLYIQNTKLEKPGSQL